MEYVNKSNFLGLLVSQTHSAVLQKKNHKNNQLSKTTKFKGCDIKGEQGLRVAQAAVTERCP